MRDFLPIELKNVSMQFGNNTVHRDITFGIAQGEVVTLIGPSGTGKTVLLKLMIGLLFPTSGTVSVFGIDMEQADEEQLLEIRSNIGMLFQGAALFDSLTVYENIAYPLRAAKRFSEAEIKDIVKHNLELINLPNIGEKYPPEISGGQKKRVGLARALAISPKVVLFDEPTTGLDPTSVRMIDEEILKLRDEFGITSVVVTHDIESAKRISDRWILLNNGSVVADGPVAEVQNNKEVHSFISGQWRE